MDASGVGTILMGVAATIVAAWGIRQNRRGEEQDAVQESAANKLAERVENYKELSAYADRLERQLAIAQGALDARDERHAAEMARVAQASDRRGDEQATRCRAALMSAMDTVHTLQGIVRDEIAVEAARTANDEASEHLRTDHPEPEDDEELGL